MRRRDLRQKLLGHLVEGSGELIIRDVGRTIQCDRCGSHLEMRTLPMTGQMLEECLHCGTSQPVQRFLPVTNDEKERQRSPTTWTPAPNQTDVRGLGARRGTF
jgi:hypothetical protein